MSDEIENISILTNDGQEFLRKTMQVHTIVIKVMIFF